MTRWSTDAPAAFAPSGDEPGSIEVQCPNCDLTFGAEYEDEAEYNLYQHQMFGRCEVTVDPADLGEQ